MAASILSGLMKTDKETKKSLDSMNLTLQKIYKLDLDKERREKKQYNETQQANKRKEKEKNVLEDILKELKKKGKDPKDKDKKKSIMETILEGVGAAMGGLGKIIGPFFGALFKASGPIFGIVTAALAGWKIGEWLNKNVIDKQVKPWLAKVDNSLREKLDKINNGGEVKINGASIRSVDVRKLIETKKISMIPSEALGIQEMDPVAKKNQQQDIDALEKMDKLIRQRQELNNKLYDYNQEIPKETDPELVAKYTNKVKELKAKMAGLEKEIVKLGKSRPALLDEIPQQTLQRGGPVTVPGQGSGDKIPMMLPPGSFVMNRNASAMLQNGGLVPTLLEPGEKVFGPNDVSPMHHMINSMIPRFQKGGEVATKSAGADQILQTLATTNKLVAQGPGMCTQSVAYTLDANKIPNPKTNNDSNNPRGYAIGLVNKYGWGSNGGTPTALSGGDGSASLGIMPQADYKANVSAGNVPSGSLVFSTRHKDWFGNSSSGYDAAIARNGGKLLWNGDGSNGKESIYGSATKSAIVLTPKGSTLKGDFTSGANGDVASSGSESQPQSPLQMIMGAASGMGVMGQIIGGVLGGISSAIGSENSWIMNALLGGPGMAMGMMGGQSPVGGGGGGGGAPGTYTGPDKVSKEVMKDALAKAGFSPDMIPKMVAIGMAESSGNAKSHNTNRDTGDNSYGLWQINMIDKLGPERRKKFGLSSNEQLFDPYVNAKAAKGIYDSQGINAWGAYKNGSYKQYLQSGGVVNMTGASSNNSNRFKQAQEEFAEMIAEKAGSPTIIVNGGGGSGGPTVIPSPNAQRLPPDLPDGPPTLLAAEQFYRLSMGSVI